MDVFKVDVTGQDIFSSKYAVIVLLNDQHAYAYKFPQQLSRDIEINFKKDLYGIQCKLKPKVYSVVLYFVLEKIVIECCPSDSEFQLQICPDMDGNQANIIDFLRNLCSNLFKKFTPDNYLFVRHPKKSKIQQFAEQVNRDDWTGINRVDIDINKLHNLIAKKEFRKNRW